MMQDKEIETLETLETLDSLVNQAEGLVEEIEQSIRDLKKAPRSQQRGITPRVRVTPKPVSHALNKGTISLEDFQTGNIPLPLTPPSSRRSPKAVPPAVEEEEDDDFDVFGDIPDLQVGDKSAELAEAEQLHNQLEINDQYRREQHARLSEAKALRSEGYNSPPDFRSFGVPSSPVGDAIDSSNGSSMLDHPFPSTPTPPSPFFADARISVKALGSEPDVTMGQHHASFLSPVTPDPRQLIRSVASSEDVSRSPFSQPSANRGQSTGRMSLLSMSKVNDGIFSPLPQSLVKGVAAEEPLSASNVRYGARHSSGRRVNLIQKSSVRNFSSPIADARRPDA